MYRLLLSTVCDEWRVSLTFGPFCAYHTLVAMHSCIRVFNNIYICIQITYSCIEYIYSIIDDCETYICIVEVNNLYNLLNKNGNGMIFFIFANISFQSCCMCSYYRINTINNKMITNLLWSLFSFKCFWMEHS